MSLLMEILVRYIEIFNQYNEKITYALEKAGIIYVKDLKCITIEEIKNMKEKLNNYEIDKENSKEANQNYD